METAILDKLRKVLALTESPVEGEAQAAAAHLSRLLQKYNLDIADLEKRGAAVAVKAEEKGHDLGKAAFKWKLDLAEGIAEFYFCAPIVNRETKKVAFVGRPDNVESLQMLYGWVIDQIRRIATEERRKHYDATGEHIDPLRWQVSFGVGAVERLIERLHEMRAREQEDASESTGEQVVALVLSREKEISDYLEETYGYRRDGREMKRDRERRERYEAQERELELLKQTDIEAYYERCPWERPETEEMRIAREKREAEYWKREERNRKKREAYVPRGGWRPGKSVDERKEAQSRTAEKSGRDNAGRVNLKPFIEGGKGGDRKKLA